MKRKSCRKWDSFAWKTIDTSSDVMGIDDAMFFGLEELDGNAYKLMKTESGSYKFDDSFDDSKEFEKRIKELKNSNEYCKFRSSLH